MVQQQPEAAGAALRAVAGSGNEPEAETETGSGAVVPMRSAERVAAALCRHAAELWLHPDRLLHSLYHGKPGSMAEYMAYVKSLAWVPPEMTGRWRAFFVITGIAYLLTIGMLLKAFAKALDAAAPHPLCMLAITVLVVALIVLL